MSELDKMVDQVDWRKIKLVPVIVQEQTGEVLTLAYMNKKALKKTLETGFAHYYSRSKERIRMKGEVSGHMQKVEEIAIDCDNDALLLKVRQKGVACHTGQKSCFYRLLGNPKVQNSGIDYSLNILKELEVLIRERKKTKKEGSYTSSLFKGQNKEILKKFGEEAIELLVAKDKEDVIYESADLLYHFLVLLVNTNVELSEVMHELRRRRKRGGNKQ